MLKNSFAGPDRPRGVPVPGADSTGRRTWDRDFNSIPVLEVSAGF